jgi:hypothetical protein
VPAQQDWAVSSSRMPERPVDGSADEAIALALRAECEAQSAIARALDAHISAPG